MASYCTQDDVRIKAGGTQSLIALSDIENLGLTSVDPVPVANAIESASATIDMYVSKHRQVPLVDVPDAIKHLCARLAVYELRAAKKAVDPETHGKDHESDVKLLEAIKDGEITIGQDAPTGPASHLRIDNASDRPTAKDWSRAKLHGFS
jgi:phage gp36-like protein